MLIFLSSSHHEMGWVMLAKRSLAQISTTRTRSEMGSHRKLNPLGAHKNVSVREWERKLIKHSPYTGNWLSPIETARNGGRVPTACLAHQEASPVRINCLSKTCCTLQTLAHVYVSSGGNFHCFPIPVLVGGSSSSPSSLSARPASVTSEQESKQTAVVVSRVECL